MTLALPEGDSVVPVWPDDFVATTSDDGVLTLEGAGHRLGVGDVVTLAGGFAAYDLPAACGDLDPFEVDQLVSQRAAR